MRMPTKPARGMEDGSTLVPTPAKKIMASRPSRNTAEKQSRKMAHAVLRDVLRRAVSGFCEQQERYSSRSH